MMTENNDASWHAWTDNDDDDADEDEDDPGPCQVQLFIAQGRCQTLRLAVQPPSYPSTAPSADKCASFSQLNAESDWALAIALATCRAAAVDALLIWNYTSAAWEQTLPQFSNNSYAGPDLSRSYHSLSVCLPLEGQKRAESVSTKRENFPKAEME